MSEITKCNCCGRSVTSTVNDLLLGNICKDCCTKYRDNRSPNELGDYIGLESRLNKWKIHKAFNNAMTDMHKLFNTGPECYVTFTRNAAIVTFYDVKGANKLASIISHGGNNRKLGHCELYTRFDVHGNRRDNIKRYYESGAVRNCKGVNEQIEVGNKKSQNNKVINRSEIKVIFSGGSELIIDKFSLDTNIKRDCWGYKDSIHNVKVIGLAINNGHVINIDNHYGFMNRLIEMFNKSESRLKNCGLLMQGTNQDGSVTWIEFGSESSPGIVDIKVP